MRKNLQLCLVVVVAAFSGFLFDVLGESAPFLKAYDYNPNKPWSCTENCVFVFWIPSENAVINAPSRELEENIERWRDRVRRELVAQNAEPIILEEFERDAPSKEFLIDQESFDDPSDDFRNAVYGAIRSILSEEPEWLEPDRWENVDIDGATIIGEDQFGAFYSPRGESKRYLYKTAGVPITLEGLQRTKQWKEKRFNQVCLRGLGGFLSLEGWTVVNSKLEGAYNLKDANLLNTSASGSFTKFLMTQNAKEGRLDDITYVPIYQSPSDLPRDYFLSGQLCRFDYNRRAFVQSKNLSRKMIVEMLEKSLEGKLRFRPKKPSYPYYSARQIAEIKNYVGEVFQGVDADDLYETKAWQIGNLAQIRFFPNLDNYLETNGDLRGWDLSRQDLTGSAFKKLDLTDVNLTDAIITETLFVDSIGLTVDQLKTTWNWSAGRMDSVILSQELREEVDRALEEESRAKGE